MKAVEINSPVSGPADEWEREALPRLGTARRRARATLAVLWAGFLASLVLLPEDAVLGLAVLLAGVSTLLESVHGALGFDKLLRRCGVS